MDHPVNKNDELPLPLQTALHTGRSVGADADLDQARQERQEAGQDGEPGTEVEVAEGEGCNSELSGIIQLSTCVVDML